jgi:hypothetical protein
MWKQHRRLIGPAMTSKSLSMMTPGVVKSVKELVGLFEAKRVKAAGRPFSMAEDFVSSAMVRVLHICFTTNRHGYIAAGWRGVR